MDSFVWLPLVIIIIVHRYTRIEETGNKKEKKQFLYFLESPHSRTVAGRGKCECTTRQITKWNTAEREKKLTTSDKRNETQSERTREKKKPSMTGTKQAKATTTSEPRQRPPLHHSCVYIFIYIFIADIYPPSLALILLCVVHSSSLRSLALVCECIVQET